MNTEKNISVTLMPSEQENNNEFVISFRTLIYYLRAYLLIWAIIAVVIGMFLSGLIMMMKKNMSSSSVTALVNFEYDGIENGLAPDGTKFDVTKIKSPNVIESALSNLGLPLDSVEKVRSNISIRGIVSSEARDKFNLFIKGSYSSGGNNAINAVEKIIESTNNPTYYTVSFKYEGYEISKGKQILDEILKGYQEYFFTMYGYNESLGNSIVAIDYTEYDYPAAIDVFQSTLDNLETYVNRLSEETPNFRSGKTGYSLEDIKNRIETIKNADLNTLSSYVAVNNVTSDKDSLLGYYQYKIDELVRNQNIFQSELNTFTASINNYEKNSMVIMGQESNNSDSDVISEEENPEDEMFNLISEKYDQLIKNKIAKQNELSKCKSDIDYYNKRIATLKNNTANLTNESKEETERRLEVLNGRINNIINIVNRTVDEYYETVTFQHAYNILVPAIGAEPWAETKDVMLPIVLAEILIFVAYFAAAFVSAAVYDSNAGKSTEENNDTDNEKE